MCGMLWHKFPEMAGIFLHVFPFYIFPLLNLPLPLGELISWFQVSIQDDDEYITEEGGVPGEPPQEKRIRWGPLTEGKTIKRNLINRPVLLTLWSFGKSFLTPRDYGFFFSKTMFLKKFWSFFFANIYYFEWYWRIQNQIFKFLPF